VVIKRILFRHYLIERRWVSNRIPRVFSNANRVFTEEIGFSVENYEPVPLKLMPESQKNLATKPPCLFGIIARAAEKLTWRGRTYPIICSWRSVARAPQL